MSQEHNNYVAAQDYHLDPPPEIVDEKSTSFDEIFPAFCHVMRVEIEDAREKHEPFHSKHEAYAVLLEEMEELKSHVFSSRFRPIDSMGEIEECLQIAAMAFCYVFECVPFVTVDMVTNTLDNPY